MKQLSVWAKRVLFTAAQLPEDAFVSRDELDFVKTRLTLLEERVLKLELFKTRSSAGSPRRT